jgi:hypothetical protein
MQADAAERGSVLAHQERRFPGNELDIWSRTRSDSRQDVATDGVREAENIHDCCRSGPLGVRRTTLQRAIDAGGSG